MVKLIEIIVPDIGDFDEVEVIEVLVQAGDHVQAEDSLITLESDKASMDIPSPYTGTIKDLKLAVGQKTSKGQVIGSIEADDVEVTKTATTPAQNKESKPEIVPVVSANKPAAPASNKLLVLPAINENGFVKAHASPAVRKFARELGADLGLITGSGQKNRILKEDVQNFVKRILTGGAPAVTGSGFVVAPPPQVDFAAYGEIEAKALNKINKLTGKYLHSSWVHIPHVTQFDEADISDLDVYRKQLSAENQDKGIKITIIAFLLKAVVAALKEFPRFNTSLDSSGENLIFKQYFHIGVAVDTPDGLVVPVIRNIDKKNLIELATEIVSIAQRAREKKIKTDELKGGCFTISSLGGVGGTAFTPIINQPEVAILGISRSAIKPIYQNDEFIPRLMLPLSLSYDHRVIDGVAAARFTRFLSEVLADVRRLEL